MKLDISRDFLDGMLIQHPNPGEGKGEVKANGGLHFLPSSPDGKLHTAVATFELSMDDQDKPFARGGWRFLFTSDESFAPNENPNHPFLKQLLVIGTTKVMTVLNPLCLHANMPITPIDPNRMANAAAPIPANGQEGQAPGSEA